VTDAVDNHSIVVVGASGDLARKKILPALFALHCRRLLPAQFSICGFARTAYSDEEFRARIAEHLTCRYTPAESCADRMAEFLGRCRYVPGDYASPNAFLDIYQRLREAEGGRPANRLFYLAIPPSVFVDVARSIGAAGLVSCGTESPWSRVVIEKPFGRDRASSDLLTRELAQVFTEAQTFRIDHYLGKELIQNLMVLRFANLVFEPTWTRDCIRSVLISWKEDIGVEGRGAYFDAYGIIRDVVQNHLLQILTMIAMEPPAGLDAQSVRDEKARVLKSIPPIGLEDLVIGQYTGSGGGATGRPGYREEAAVRPDSLTPTFAAMALAVRNPRWEGVPFLIRAGKGLDVRQTEIRLRFREAPGNLFRGAGGCPPPNELVIRVQPDEAIYLRVASKVPGLTLRIEPRNLDLRYKAAFTEEIPDAYESLLLDVLRGEKSLFLRSDELATAWDVFTPALHELDRQRLTPAPYARGSRGPATADALAARYGEKWD
jgi:glucose-6-phosphate 1-dehydrogenase